ncbi:antitoxin [Dermabacteraceae bacterium P13115]|nr:antitoxin [Dermabacteraceae bacterium TAE3-ERU5]
MGFDDALNKAKDFALEHTEEAKEALEKGAEALKDKAPEGVKDYVEKGAEALKNGLDGLK